ncbi:hypothetical protein [Ramlibacter albus]|uniref:Uncharacterized protein n=1 Tax=Ramlibacter albus TaxID=2079448 RepID=A0A923MB75_9BURK|nr:hypothetical protein [Ramlibacter albus]MBC5767430.1 hypothetical protein [Ramlibacter albus]
MSTPLQVRLHARDSSIFVDGIYLIRGVAGALLWKMLNDHVHAGRSDFCYRELRLAPALRLPEAVDNLAARLVLLQRRLADQCVHLRLEKVARGLVRLHVSRPVDLGEI